VVIVCSKQRETVYPDPRGVVASRCPTGTPGRARVGNTVDGAPSVGATRPARATKATASESICALAANPSGAGR